MPPSSNYKMQILDHLSRCPPSSPPSAEQPTSYVVYCLLQVILLHSSLLKYFLYYEREESRAGALQFLSFPVSKKRKSFNLLVFCMIYTLSKCWKTIRRGKTAGSLLAGFRPASGWEAVALWFIWSFVD